MEKLLISKHNELIQAGYRLTLNEIRIIQYGISLINPMSEDFPLEYQINVKRFIALFELKNDKQIYAEIKKAAMKKLWDREVTINIDEKYKKRLRWVTGIEYADNLGYLKIYINPLLKPWLHQLKNYTSYNIKRISSFKSVHSFRIYEITIMNLNKSNGNKHSFNIEINHLKEQLGITGKYKKITDFNLYVLEVAKKEINKYSDIRLSYTLKKQGRAFHEIKFTVTKKKPDPGLVATPNKPILSAPILKKAESIVEGSGTNWALKEIEKQFFAYTEKAGEPKNIEGAFIGFVKNKVKNWAA